MFCVIRSFLSQPLVMMESMKLAAWAKENGVARQTATRWFDSGVLPVDARQLSTGTVLVEERPLRDRTGVALFARVSSSDQRSDLDRQLARLTEAATTAGLAPTRERSRRLAAGVTAIVRS